MFPGSLQILFLFRLAYMTRAREFLEDSSIFSGEPLEILLPRKVEH